MRTRLKLFHYYVLYEISNQFEKKEIPLISDLRTLLTSPIELQEIEESYSNKKYPFFQEWKRKLKLDAERMIDKLVGFKYVYSSGDDQTSLKNFKKSQEMTIINSEIIEKNDGKASYILRRLFKAYMTNPHQLSDLALEYMLRGIQHSNFNNDIADTLKVKLKELSDTLLMAENKSQKIEEVSGAISDGLRFGDKDYFEDELIEKDLSNEAKALFDGAKDLAKFVIKYYEKGCLIPREFNCKERQRHFREILDNVLLRAMPIWKSILVRGICDHIAGMTDQEAISEYEKLYTGVMELV